MSIDMTTHIGKKFMLRASGSDQRAQPDLRDLFDATSLEAMFLMVGIAVYLIIWLQKSHSAKAFGTSPKHQDTMTAPAPKKNPLQLVEEMAACVDRSHGRVLDMYFRSNGRVDWMIVPPELANQAFFNICLTAAFMGRKDILDGVLQDMRKLGVSRSSGTYTAVVKMMSAKKLFKDVLALWEHMQQDDVEVEQTTCSCLLLSAVEEQDQKMAMKFFEMLKAMGMATSRDFGSMIRIFTKAEDAPTVVALLREMLALKLEPSSFTFNNAFSLCCAGGKHLELAEEVLDIMRTSAGATLDAVTFNTLIKAYAQAGRYSDAFAQVKEMEKIGLTPTAVTYGTLLDVCVAEGNFDKAQRIFQQLLASGCKINTIIWTTLIKCFARAGRSDDAVKVYHTMISRGCHPDGMTYSTLLKALCDSKDMERALAFVDDMGKMGHKPDDVIFNNLLHGCVVTQRLELGERLFHDMKAVGVKPTPSTISIMLKLYGECSAPQQALDLLQRMEADFGVAAEQRLYLQLCATCLRARRWHMAVRSWQSSLEKFGLPEDKEITRLIRAAVNFNLLEAALEMAEQVLMKDRKLASILPFQMIVDKGWKSPKNKDAVIRLATRISQEYGIHMDLGKQGA